VVDGIEGSHEGSPVGKRMQRHMKFGVSL